MNSSKKPSHIVVEYIAIQFPHPRAMNGRADELIQYAFGHAFLEIDVDLGVVPFAVRDDDVPDEPSLFPVSDMDAGRIGPVHENIVFDRSVIAFPQFNRYADAQVFPHDVIGRAVIQVDAPSFAIAEPIVADDDRFLASRQTSPAPCDAGPWDWDMHQNRSRPHELKGP